MRAAIDATPLLLRSAGVKTYIYHWVRSLKAAARGHQLKLFPFLADPPEQHAFAHQLSVLPTLPTAARLGFLYGVNRIPLPILNPLGSKLDVFHASHQLRRPPRNTRVTATLYDMTCWIVSGMHTAANVAGAKRFADAVLKRADGLIAISESTKKDAVAILGLNPDRIEVIYPGVPNSFFGATPTIRKKPYLLFVGTIEPRKNVDVLLDAYQQLPASLRDQYDLVVAGSAGWGERGTLHRLRSGLPGVDYLGYVPEEDLPGLTAGATLFVYPSLYEGFGLPVAQAMAGAVPVITSSVSSLPEVGGDGAVLVDPRSVSELSAAIEKVLLSPRLQSELRSNGVRRAQRYRWEACAEQSWRFFERIVS